METFALSLNASFPPSTLHSSFRATKTTKPNLTAAKPPRAAASDGGSSGDEEARAQQKGKKPLHEIIFKPLDNLISTFNSSHLPSYLDPEHVLSGSFSPAEELPPTPCQVVEGSLPSCLDGAYLQNGPNPQFTPRGPYHLVDGDGMIHAVKIAGGEATFCSRFVETNKYMAERDLGYPVYPNMFGAFTSKITASLLLTAARILTGQFNPFSNGVGTANTSLALIAGELFALVETDIPYQITVTENGDVATVGRRDFDSPESFQIMTAHPKFDPDTGETFSFRYFPIPPFLKLFRIDSDGKKHKSVPIYSMKNCSFVHDFAVTKRFAVFPDTQIAIEPIEILRGKSTMRVDLQKIPKLGVIPRYAADESEMYWIDAEAAIARWRDGCMGRTATEASRFSWRGRGRRRRTMDIWWPVKLPRRVPQGFHSIFVKQTELLKM
ncbi:ccd4,nced4 [Salvia divinorum]|uniref:Ccd4,nced4 n=1 Tax=Salvia divinorum TaxID=28513 RepID=A0ABD1FKC1_SALDI